MSVALARALRSVVAVAAVVGWCHIFDSPGLAADVDKTFRLPALTVSPSGDAGELRHVGFTLTRKTPAKTPLTIAVAEDTPGGAGESARASVWMAAMVAALDRRDDLSGVRILIQVPGQVDGGSAGGLVCLAILTALDGKDLPADFAMTGSIMPDGTIGAVSGMARKIRAAAAGGARRVLVPANIRFETDVKSGEQVDLRRLAASLRLELIPVESVTQAHAAVHRTPARAAVRPGRAALDVPEATEELLKKAYAEHAKAGAKLWEAIPEQERQQIAQDPFSKLVLIDVRRKAEVGYRSGRLLYASETVWAWRLFLEARAKNEVLFQGLKGQDLRANVGQLDARLRELVQATPNASSLIAASQKTVPEAGIQLCGGFNQFHGLLGIIAVFQGLVDQAAAELDDPENKAEERQAELATRVAVGKYTQLLLAHCTHDGQAAAVGHAGRLAATLPGRKMTGDVAGVERLFFSAFLAAHNSFDKDIVKTAAAQLQAGNEQALAAMAEHDMSLVMYLPVAAAVQALHADLVAGKRQLDPRFAGAAAAHAHADALALVSGLITRWGELGVEVNDQGELRYGRTDQLNYLLTAARENALAAIAECRARGIPCVQPVYCFEAAELGRDDRDEDKVDVLASYWNASLQAKVLLMLFDGKPAK